ncbi:S8 family peptidase [Niabella beijingensis]|uniref:S8 family peptidase n=1 Tax=Niabella beijingensis TaxID=2872700 RepID=UPI001CBC4895|nr:S8 family serine peptidase [Niabella beijingensis]MBZ4187645.1 S8 family serine peptidase [Niabella beijingensis]
MNNNQNQPVWCVKRLPSIALCASFFLTIFVGCDKRDLRTAEESSMERSAANTSLELAKKSGEVFYYSSKRKNYLSMDTNALVLKPKKNVAVQDMKTGALSGVNVVDLGNGLYSVNDSKGASDLLNKLNDADKIEASWFSLKHGDNMFLPTGEIFLQPKGNVSAESIIGKLNLANAVSKVRFNAKENVARIVCNNKKDVFSIANSIYESGLVEWSHPDFIIPIEGSSVPTDFYYVEQWYMDNWGQSGGVSGIDINAEPAWDITKGDSSIKVAVIDYDGFGGIHTHEDLPASRILPGYNNGAATVGGGHTQCVAGIIAASQNNDGTYPSYTMYSTTGVAPECKLIPIGMYYFSFSNIDDALDQALLNGADVLCCPWNYLRNNNGMIEPVTLDALINKFNYVRANGRGGKGLPIIFPSGNDNAAVRFPADIPGIISVGAVDHRGYRATYSNYGTNLFLVGCSSYEMRPLGDITCMDAMGSYGYESGNMWRGFFGTSAACAEVSGVVALMLSIKPTLTEAQVRSILQSTATDMGASGYDSQFGYGRVNAGSAVYQASITP